MFAPGGQSNSMWLTVVSRRSVTSEVEDAELVDACAIAHPAMVWVVSAAVRSPRMSRLAGRMTVTVSPAENIYPPRLGLDGGDPAAFPSAAQRLQLIGREIQQPRRGVLGSRDA